MRRSHSQARASALACRSPMIDALGFFALVELAGLAAVPLAGLAFARLPGAGLGFAKPLGVLLVTWLAWMAASLGVASYGTGTIVGAWALVAIAGALVAARARSLARRAREAPAAPTGLLARRRRRRVAARALPVHDPARRS